MNNREAIEVLRQIPQRYFYGRRVNGKQITIEALNLAIKALEERPTGEWILERIYYDNYHMIDNNIFYCSICGRRVTTTASKATVAVVYPFCHGCGTKMEEKSE